jgi:hypothetical protein
MGYSVFPAPSSGITTSNLEWVKIASGTFSGTSYTISNLAGYKSFKFFGAVEAATSDNMNLRLNGSSSAVYYQKMAFNRGDLHDAYVTTKNADSNFFLGYTTTSDWNNTIEFEITAAGSGMPTMISVKNIQQSGVWQGWGTGVFDDTNEITSMTFFGTASGTLSREFWLWGKTW